MGPLIPLFWLVPVVLLAFAAPAAGASTAAPLQPSAVHGDLATAKHVALLVLADGDPSPGPAPAPYRASLEIRIDPLTADPVEEGRRLRAAFDGLLHVEARIDVWCRGFAGLIVRSTLETSPKPPTVAALVMIDVPHRGVSASGWPDWASGGRAGQRAAVPGWTISGSPFLLGLNRAGGDTMPIEHFNVWQQRRAWTPRASVMQLPRAAWQLVVASESDATWSVLSAPIVAVRRTGVDGLPARAGGEGAMVPEERIVAHAPRHTKAPRPSLRTILDGSGSFPAAASESWVRFAAAVSTRHPDPLIGMTDLLGVVWHPAARRLVFFGLEDYAREPLRSELLTAAIKAYRAGLPAISIDPPRSSTPSGQAPVRYEAGLQHTRLGGLMFEADRVMKGLGLDQDNVTGSPIGSRVEEHQSVSEGSAREGDTGARRWRLWFEPARWHAREPRPTAAFFDARFRIKWEKLSPGYAPSQSVLRFTENLTTRFGHYAQEQPSLDHLDQSGAVAVAAKWLVDANLALTASEPSAVTTPSLTPLVETRTVATAGIYEIINVVQGGTVTSPSIRHVKADSEAERQILAALAEAPPAGGRPGASSGSVSPPERRPPGSTAQPGSSRGPPLQGLFTADTRPFASSGPTDFRENAPLLVFAGFPGHSPNPQASIGIRHPQSAWDTPPASADALIRQRSAFGLPNITSVSVDDAEESVVMWFRGEAFGDQRGEVFLDGAPLDVKKWKKDTVAITVPAQVAPGTLWLRTAQGELSNRVTLTVITAPARGPPPRLTFVNQASFPIRVDLNPVVATPNSSSREYDVPAGQSLSFRVNEGSYRFSYSTSDRAVLGAARDEVLKFDRSGEYRITFVPPPMGKVRVSNATGGVLRFELTGPVNEKVELSKERSHELTLKEGTYRLSVSAQCGTTSRDLTITPGAIATLSYECIMRFK